MSSGGTAEISARASIPESIFSAVWIVIRRAAWMSMYDSAMKPWMNCLSRSSPPCTSRSIAREIIRSYARHI